jgi:hypothetical protein
MRRRLNMALHLYGIVEGLQLSSTTNAGITQVSISAGMAIDSFGREIYLLAPYTFDDIQDVQANRITAQDDYQVWIQYVRQANTPPSVGYAACNQTAETTRWQETYRIVLLNNASAATPPAVTDDISEEDPDTDTSNGVLLGVVTVTPGAAGGAFDLPHTSTVPPQPKPQPPLTYIGLRAQRIQPPNFPDTVSLAFDITKADDALVPPIGVDVPSNLFAEQDLVVGPNFPVTLPSGVTPPAAGNVKVAGDLFLLGDCFFPTPGGTWQKLADLIKGLVPDIQAGQFSVPGGPGQITGDVSSGTLSLKLTTAVKNVKTAQIIASVTGMTFNTVANLNTINTDVGGNLAISVNAIWAGNSTNPGPFTISWTVGPVDTPKSLIPLNLLTISWVVIFYPQ